MIETLVFDDMTQCTVAGVERLAAAVPEPRLSQAMRFTHVLGRFTCLKSYEMLAVLLREHFGLERFSMEYGEHGKPFVTGRPDVHFNISHCRSAIAVAVSDRPVGIDVESFRKLSDGLIRRTMNSTESDAILASDNPEREFARLWTRKEAVFKLMGTGITDNIPDILSQPGIAVDTSVNDRLGYALSTAGYIL